MAINDVAGGRAYHVLREFLRHNFVSGLRISKHKKTFLKTKKTKKLKTTKLFHEILGFYSPARYSNLISA